MYTSVFREVAIKGITFVVGAGGFLNKGVGGSLRA